jgi:hypothetical protein
MLAVAQEEDLSDGIPEFDELEKLRETVEREHKSLRDRLSQTDQKNRKFFERAAKQIDTNEDARKLLRMVCAAAASQLRCFSRLACRT